MKIGTESGRETPAADRVPGRGQQEEGGVDLGGEAPWYSSNTGG